MDANGGLPDGLVLQRVTEEFTADSVPKGLLRAHRIAEGVWGLIKVREGTLTFVEETHPITTTVLHGGDEQVVQPGVPHHVEPGRDARFAIEFYR